MILTKMFHVKHFHRLISHCLLLLKFVYKALIIIRLCDFFNIEGRQERKLEHPG